MLKIDGPWAWYGQLSVLSWAQIRHKTHQMGKSEMPCCLKKPSGRSMATSTSTGNASVRGRSEGTAKGNVAEQISQAIQSTSNLLQLMHQSSPSQAQLMKLPRNLLAKASTIKNTGLVLEQMPPVISSLDAHVESGLQSVPYLRTVTQLLANMESCQLSSVSNTHLPQAESDQPNQPPEEGQVK